MPSEHLLPRRHEYTRVYTTVYPRVHNCIHACTQVRSKYLLCRARLYVYSLGIMPRIFSDGLRLPGIGNNTPEDPKAGVSERDHVPDLPSSGGLYSLSPFRPHTPISRVSEEVTRGGKLERQKLSPQRGTEKFFPEYKKTDE